MGCFGLGGFCSVFFFILGGFVVVLVFWDFFLVFWDGVLCDGFWFYFFSLLKLNDQCILY